MALLLVCVLAVAPWLGVFRLRRTRRSSSGPVLKRIPLRPWVRLLSVGAIAMLLYQAKSPLRAVLAGWSSLTEAVFDLALLSFVAGMVSLFFLYLRHGHIELSADSGVVFREWASWREVQQIEESGARLRLRFDDPSMGLTILRIFYRWTPDDVTLIKRLHRQALGPGSLTSA